MTEKTTTMDVSGMAVFYISEIGPDLLYHDFAKLADSYLKETDVEKYLFQMANAYISALSFGNQFFEGVFDLPAGHLSKYRSLLISVNVPDPTQTEVHLALGYLQIVMFIPLSVAKRLPSIANFQTEIISIIKQHISGPDSVSMKIFQRLRPILEEYIKELPKRR